MMRIRRCLTNSKGFTLIEVLASVVILSVFVMSLLALVTDLLTESRHLAQKQQALLIARNVLNQMAATSVSAQTGDRTVTYNGVTYAVHATQVSNPPLWAYGQVYAEVKVSWRSVRNGQSAQDFVDVTQGFPQ